jgi:DNA-directed RNA polymerase specialized sigma24 family protein
MAGSRGNKVPPGLVSTYINWVEHPMTIDRVALCLLHEAYYPRLARLFSHLTTTRDPELIGSLIEETMLSAWIARESPDTATSVYVWIMGLAVELAMRPARLMTGSHEHDSPPFHTAQTADRDITSAIESGPTRWIYALLGPLSVEERAVVHFVYTGHSCQDIADIMSLSCEQVKELLCRAAIYMRSASAATLRERYGYFAAVVSAVTPDLGASDSSSATVASRPAFATAVGAGAPGPGGGGWRA